VTVTAAELPATIQRLKDEGYTRFVDLTAVDYPDRQERFELNYLLYHMRDHAWVRVKATTAGQAPSVTSIFGGANPYEREVYDMFGVTFRGHPDLRRILMWETYAEGYPLRKGFPLRGRFSRAEQVRQALAANPEAHYSMEELSIAQAYDELPPDMKERLRRGERAKIPYSE